MVGLGAAGAWAATRPSGPSYRIATAGPGNVAENLVTTGTVQPISQATLSFPLSGQVATVAVQVGQQVTAGQTLASLDTTGLSAQVSAAQSTLAGAQAKLAADQASQTAAVTAAPASTAHTTAGTSAGQNATAARGKPSSAAAAQVTSAQQDVLRAQQQVDADLAKSRRDLATLQSVLGSCSSAPTQSTRPTTSTSPSPPPSATSSAGSGSGSSASSTPPPTPSETTSPSSAADGPTCQQAVNQVADDQNRTASDVQTLTKAEDSLTAVLNQAVQHAGAAPAPAGSSAGSSSAGRGGTPSTAGGAGSASHGGSGLPATAASIAADQASVDAANAQLVAVQQNLATATLTSPMSGTVAQIGFTVGQSAGQSTIQIVGPGQEEVATTVSDTSVGRVKVGQRVTVTPDGMARTLTGKVASMGLLSTSSSGTASFPVTIALDPTDQQLPLGSAASLSIILNSTPAAVTVPTSAVQTLGGASLVSVLRNGSPTPTRVTLGVVGSTLAQVTSGVNAGDQVVLANLDAPLPTATNNQGFRVIGGGGGGGGGRFGGAGGGRGPGG